MLKMMKALTVCMGLMGLMTTVVEARDWTNRAGRTIQADLIAVKQSAGGEVAVLRLSNGQVHEVPLAQLSDADQTFAREEGSRQSANKPGAMEEKKFSVLGELLKNKLVALDGRRVAKYEMTEEPQYYALYFTASWCGPCRTFTPKLIEFYNGSAGKKGKFEVIMVSRDDSEQAMEGYMKGDQMPWPAIAFRQVDRLKEINKYAGSGIPCLVLVDREGKVLSHSYENGSYVGPTRVMKVIEEKARAGS